MGNWRDRRRRNFQKQKTPWSTVRNYDNEPPLESWQDGIPLWEKKFCTEIGYVPWRKILDSKKFIYHHLNILKWDDSACEEAFHNAKRRFWAEISGHQCDNYLPDPDIYIDQIDWNPKIDPELIEEVDRAYFAPEAVQSDIWLECKNKKSRNSYSVSADDHNEGPDHVDNPWEHSTKCSDNKGLWSQWNCSDSGKVNDLNPWDSYLTQENRVMVDNAWGDDKFKVWDSENGRCRSNGFRVSGKGGSNAWNEGHQGAISWKNKELASDERNQSWGWNQQGASNFDNNNKPWDNSCDRNSRTLKDRMRSNSRGNEEDWKYQFSNRKRPKDAEFEKTGRWGSRNHTAENWESPHRHVSSWRYSRPQRNGYQR